MRTCQFLIILSLCPVASAFAQEASGIYKCIIAKKTIYSDHVCGKPGSVTEVELHHAKGIVSPGRETVADTRARIQDQMWVDEEPGRTKSRTITRNGVGKTYSVSSTSAPVRAGLGPWRCLGHSKASVAGDRRSLASFLRWVVVP